MEGRHTRAAHAWPIFAAAIAGLGALAVDQFAKIETLQIGRVSLSALGFLYFVLVLVNEVTAAECGANCLPRYRLYSYCVSIPVLGFFGWMCWTAAPRFAVIPWPIVVVGLSAAVVFAVAGVTCATPNRQTFAHLGADCIRCFRQPVTIAAVVAISAVVLWSPTLSVRHGPMGDEFEQWFAAQPRQPVPTSLARAPVTIVEFRDYSSASWRSAHAYYRKYFEELVSNFPRAVEIVTLDFPMDATCNPAVIDSGSNTACHLAAAMRVAASHGVAEMFQSWVAEQSAILEDAPMAKLRSLLGTVPDGELGKAFDAVRLDIETGQEMGITVAPSYLINGVRVGFIPLVNFRVAVAHEMRAAHIG
jgi:hypothetical protein